MNQDFQYLQSFRTSSMSLTQKQSYEVMEYFVEQNLKREFNDQFEYHHYLINQFMGAQSEIIAFISKYHRIENLNQAEAFLIRVRKTTTIFTSVFLFFFRMKFQVQRISKAFNQLIEQQIERRRRNIETPRFVLERVIHELETFQNQLQNEPNRW